MNRKYIALTLTCVLAGFAAGCGDDDDDNGGGGGSDAPTKAEYVQQADRICTQGDNAMSREAEQRFGDVQGEPSQAQIEEFANDIVIPNIEDQIAQLRELTPPEGDEETVNEIYDKADEAIADLKDDPRGVVEDDAGPFKEANQLAQDYGLKVCGAS